MTISNLQEHSNGLLFTNFGKNLRRAINIVLNGR